jgi:hypothetical protein
MGLFKGLRQKIGNSILAGKLIKLKRKAKYLNFSQVRNIGIVWDASRVDDFNSISKFHQKMHDRNIDVKVLGLYTDKELPNKYTALRYLTCIRKSELNYFFFPVSTEAEKFIRTPFNILIDINFGNEFPLECITRLSYAAFKVGLYDPSANNPACDLMMDLKKPVRIDDFFDQAIYYLEIINAESPVQSIQVETN